MKSVTTEKGTILPLTNLKGKDYLMVAYRIQWMNETCPNFEITTDFLTLEQDLTVCKAKVVLKDDKGNITKSATATKREDKQGFGDHMEKAETGAIGRALALLGFGTQFAVSDLDEGSRIVDSPVVNTKQSMNIIVADKKPEALVLPKESKPTSFRKTPQNGKSSEVVPVAEPKWE